jgi:hypothetical protein
LNNYYFQIQFRPNILAPSELFFLTIPCFLMCVWGRCPAGRTTTCEGDTVLYTGLNNTKSSKATPLNSSIGHR